MVGDLILEHDEVALPGVGTFVAELVGASFSDKGFTINPPYRKLSFRQREGDPDLLIDFYAKTNSLEKSTAAEILTRFLTEMKEVLKTKKYVVFPGLGRLRATKENLFFFVPDEDLNIYPEGFGLEPVSLKSHEELEEVTELAETVEAVEEITAPADKTAVAAAPVAPEPVVSEPATPASAASKPVAPAPVTSKPASKPAHSHHESGSEHHHHHHHHHSGSHSRSSRRRKLPVWQKELIILASAAVVLLLLLAIAGRVAPEFVDRFLYSREELEILYR